MKKSIFRSPDFWRSAILKLPDNSFFELLRSIFGSVKTPFNKQRLMADLTALLSREEIQKNIFDYIDQTDARIIAAVALLEEPFPGELESFFAGDLSYAVLHDILLNLEERFILYRFREEGQNRLALNPVLEPVLAPFINDMSLLFPSVPPVSAEELAGQLLPKTPEARSAASAPALKPVADDRLIGGILSFVSGEGLFFKNEGGIRKKILDAGARIFPGSDLESLTGGLLLLGLLREEGDGFIPDEQRLASFAELSSRERMEYWAAGIYCFQNEKGAFEAAAGYLFRNRVFSLAALIHRLAALIKPDRWYLQETLKRYGIILEREARGIRREGVEEGVFFDKLTGVMETLGLLVSPAPGYWTAGSLVHGGTEAGSDGAAVQGAGLSPLLAMDSPFSCILHPGIAFADILKLASFLIVREAGVVVRFELTRESAVRGFDRGLKAAEMIENFERLSRSRIDENLDWSLKDWEKRYGQVNLRRGLVLTLSEDRRYLAEAEPVADLIQETLGPGVYLLSGSGPEAAEEALRKAGVDIISRQAGWTAPGGRYGGRNAFSSLENTGFFPGYQEQGLGREKAPEASPPAAGSVFGPQGEALKKQFHAALENMSLSKEERDELASRINRRQILGSSQLNGASVRYEKLEARLLDYVGKAAIAKQAISSKSLVEITWSHPQKGLIQATGIPTALEKTGGESVLVLNPLSPEEPLRVPLGKISLLRRIKKSIFGE
ncbi:MAG: helicase-associated domain-containing protein [Treponema sp.]|jgi:hypothetical protein|nr:helicase-associated domain-containing protein [Treponema sp.]